jgi:tRNA/rRNA methyltransferase
VYQSHATPLYNQFLLTESQRERLDVVLVSPRNPLNIGAAARAMANFGFSRLAVVAPYEPHWREAKSAVQAEYLLQNARCTQCLSEAVADCTLVAGTGTLEHRKPEQPVVSLPALAPIIQSELARGGRIALVFGQEKHGLTREDLALCHVLVEIPTDLRQPSMNLGQAVAVCLYELASRHLGADAANDDRAKAAATAIIGAPGASGPGSLGTRDSNMPFDSSATSAQLDLLADVIGRAMAAASYSPDAMRNANLHHLHLMLRRMALTRQDAKRILGLFRRIVWRMEQRAGRAPE